MILSASGVRRVARVVDPLELRLHPLPREPEALDLGRLDERRQVVEQQRRVDGDPVLDEALVAQPGQQRLVVLDGGDPDQRAHRQRQRALGQPRDGAEVEDAHAGRAARPRWAGSGSCPGAGRRAASRCGPGRRRGSGRRARRSGRAPPGSRDDDPAPATRWTPATP